MRTGRLSPVLVTEPEIARLAGGREAHRAAQAATLELIAHAMLLSASQFVNILWAGPAHGRV